MNILTITLFGLFFSGLALASQTCKETVSISAEGAYLELLEKSKPNKTYAESQREVLQVQQLLSSVLRDVPGRLEELFMNLTPEMVQIQLKNDQQRFKILNGNFKLTQEGYYLPKAEGYKDIKRVAEYNITKNAAQVEHMNFYRNPGFEARSNPEFLFLAPNKSPDYSIGQFMQFLSAAVTPVNAYGKEFSQNLLITTALMMDIIASDREMTTISQKIYYGYPTLSMHHMTRVRESQAYGPLAGVLEGVVSFNQVVSSLLAEKIPGIETGSEALQAIIDGGQSKSMGLTAEFTSRLPLGVIGPMTHGGFYFSNPVKIGPEGRLVLSDTLTQTLSNLVKIMVKNQKPKSRCPMSSMMVKFGFKKPEHNPHAGMSDQQISALQVLAETYLHVFKLVEKNSNTHKK